MRQYNGHMTTIAERPAPTRAISWGAAPEFDPFTPPAITCPIGACRARNRVAITATVVASRVVRWPGGDVLEVTVADDTGIVTLAFLGSRRVPGLGLGRHLVAGGTLTRRGDRLVMLNPYYWLVPSTATSIGPGRWPSHC